MPVQLIQLAVHANSSTLDGRLYGRTSKFFRLDGLLLFCIIMGLHSVSSAINFRDVVIFYTLTSNEYANYPFCSPHISKEADKENLFHNQELF